MLRRRSQLHVEMLEDRSVPAVTVLGFNTADIKITGDNQSNDIDITMTNQGIEVQANGATTLALDPNTPGSWVVTNTPTLIVLNPNGPNNPPTLDNLFVDMLNGDDKVTATSLNATGSAYFTMGNGNDILRIGACRFGNNLFIRDPSGNDTVVIDNTTVGVNTYIYLTSGLDRVYIAGNGTVFGNDLFINTAGGNDLVRFIPGLSQVGNNLLIYTGGGNDRVFVDNGTSGTATLQVFGTTVIRTDVGDDLVRFGAPSTTVGGPTVDLQTTIIDTGDNNDAIFMEDAIMSLLIALLGNGDDKVLNNWGASNVTVGFGSLLDGGNHVVGDTLPTPWTAPANLTVINFP
jgi:hypothetical protein